MRLWRQTYKSLAGALLYCSKLVWAQQALGVGGCAGFRLDTSKYCPAFKSSVLGPVNFTNPLKVLFWLVNNDEKEAEILRSFKADNINSADAFDKRIMEGIVLKKLPQINQIWFRCKHETYGVLYSLSWYCNLLLNYPFEGMSNPCRLTSEPTGLCLSTSEAIFVDAAENLYRDKSCLSTGQPVARTKEALRLIASKYTSSEAASSEKPSCIAGNSNEVARELCGYPTMAAACSNKCSTAKCDESNLIIYAIIITGVVLLLIGLVVLYKVRRTTKPKVTTSPPASNPRRGSRSRKLVHQGETSETVQVPVESAILEWVEQLDEKKPRKKRMTRNGIPISCQSTRLSQLRSIIPEDSASNIFTAFNNRRPHEVALPDGTPAFKVFAPYTKQLDDEITIDPDDFVKICQEFSDGWGSGQVVDPISGLAIGPVGAFPLIALNINQGAEKN